MSRNVWKSMQKWLPNSWPAARANVRENEDLFFLSSELSSVWYLGLSWALRDALACSGAVILCVSPLFLTLNLSPSSSAAC